MSRQQDDLSAARGIVFGLAISALGVLILLAVVVLAGCAPSGTPSGELPSSSTRPLIENMPSPGAPITSMHDAAPTGIDRVLDTGHIPAGDYAAYPTGCHSPADGVADPRCTHGAADVRVTDDNVDSTICVKAQPRAPDNETARLKRIAMQAYGITRPAGDVELDHLVSLELGGANVGTNLWPEVTDRGHGVNNDKDTAENNAHRLVCKHVIRLSDAQRTIASPNWRTLLPHP